MSGHRRYVRPHEKPLHTCCGGDARCTKFCFSSRKQAKRYGDRTAPGQNINAYQCDFGGCFHWGHMDSAIARGRASRKHHADRLRDLGQL